MYKGLSVKSKLKKRIFEEKAITLIALVISIIVILILAGVTIVTLTGENGILTRTQTAVENNNALQEEEMIKLAVQAAKVAGQGTITTENLNIELRNNFGDNNIVEVISNGWRYKKYKIYPNGTIDNLLPIEYQQVKYIESSGKQWIDTGKYLGYNNSFEMRINGSYWPRPTFGKNSNLRECFISGYDVYLNGKGFRINFETNTWYHIIMDTTDGNANFYVNNELLLHSGGSNNHGKVYLFGGSASYEKYDIDTFAKYKLEIFKTYNNGVLEQYLLPCYRKSDNIIGMYDIANDIFFTNQGSGTFGYETEDGTYVTPQ